MLWKLQNDTSAKTMFQTTRKVNFHCPNWCERFLL